MKIDFQEGETIHHKKTKKKYQIMFIEENRIHIVPIEELEKQVFETEIITIEELKNYDKTTMDRR